MIQIKIDKKERAQIKAVMAFCDRLDEEGKQSLSNQIRQHLKALAEKNIGELFGIKQVVKGLPIVSLVPGGQSVYDYLDQMDNLPKPEATPIADKEHAFRNKVAELKIFHPYPTENEIENIRKQVYG